MLKTSHCADKLSDAMMVIIASIGCVNATTLMDSRKDDSLHWFCNNQRILAYRLMDRLDRLVPWSALSFDRAGRCFEKATLKKAMPDAGCFLAVNTAARDSETAQPQRQSMGSQGKADHNGPSLASRTALFKRLILLKYQPTN